MSPFGDLSESVEILGLPWSLVSKSRISDSFCWGFSVHCTGRAPSTWSLNLQYSLYVGLLLVMCISLFECMWGFKTSWAKCFFVASIILVPYLRHACELMGCLFYECIVEWLLLNSFLQQTARTYVPYQNHFFPHLCVVMELPCFEALIAILEGGSIFCLPPFFSISVNRWLCHLPRVIDTLCTAATLVKTADGKTRFQ